MTASRLLVVVRHAKAEQYAATDRDRVLSARGAAAAADLGRWLTTVDAVPEHAVVSGACRAVQTWEGLAAASGSTATASVDDALVNGSPEVVLEALRAVPEDVGVLAFVGHNPTASYLAHLLDDGEGDPAAFAAMSEGYPTAAASVLAVPGPWAALDVAGAAIRHFYVGRETA